MPQPVKIDFVSDIACPWCAVGLRSLEEAMARVGDALEVELHFQPFELNPHMPPEGQDAVEHITAKYGINAAQVAQNAEALRARGAALGFVFDTGKRRRVVNTFDAHRLLHWAGTQGAAQQLALKHALLRGYFSEGQDVSAHDTLVGLAVQAGLDGARAREILASEAYAEDVRRQERHSPDQGISAVPSVILNDRHLIQGGQPVALFESALRELSGIEAHDAA